VDAIDLSAPLPATGYNTNLSFVIDDTFLETLSPGYNILLSRGASPQSKLEKLQQLDWDIVTLPSLAHIPPRQGS
jgi:hypothetical protein